MHFLITIYLLFAPIPVTITVYNATPEQTNGCQFTTASGYKIDTANISRIIAISPDLRQHFDFGDTVWVICSDLRIHGQYVVRDLTSSRLTKTVDVLQCEKNGIIGKWNGYIAKNLYIY